MASILSIQANIPTNERNSFTNVSHTQKVKISAFTVFQNGVKIKSFSMLWCLPYFDFLSFEVSNYISSQLKSFAERTRLLIVRIVFFSQPQQLRLDGGSSSSCHSKQEMKFSLVIFSPCQLEILQLKCIWPQLINTICTIEVFKKPQKVQRRFSCIKVRKCCNGFKCSMILKIISD